MNTDKNWFALEITVDAKASEAVEFGLNELGALGTEINNLGVKPQETLSVIGYFNEPPPDQTVRAELDEALRIYGFSPDAIRQTDWRRVGNVDWLFEWKKHWKPTETEKFIVAPTWETVENPDKILVFIEPGMAFGTGTHQTTKLCLRAIEKHYKNAMSFLDVGTGTGILAIAASKFGTQDSERSVEDFDLANLNSETQTLNSFWACDTDVNSIEIAKQNAELNDINEINFFVGSISEETPRFDFVCANITVDVITPILRLLIEKAEKVLVLSGILKEQESLVTEELNKFQISNLEIETDGEWISITVEREK
jgi:ribosomal protein L11 methyltransferase